MSFLLGPVNGLLPVTHPLYERTAAGSTVVPGVWPGSSRTGHTRAPQSPSVYPGRPDALTIREYWSGPAAQMVAPDPATRPREIAVLDPFDRLVRTHTRRANAELRLLLVVRRAERDGPSIDHRQGDGSGGGPPSVAVRMTNVGSASRDAASRREP